MTLDMRPRSLGSYELLGLLWSAHVHGQFNLQSSYDTSGLKGKHMNYLLKLSFTPWHPVSCEACQYLSEKPQPPHGEARESCRDSSVVVVVSCHSCFSFPSPLQQANRNLLTYISVFVACDAVRDSYMQVKSTQHWNLWWGPRLSMLFWTLALS